MRLRWSDQAKADLREIGRYIAQDDPRAARRWVEKLRERARLAATQPRGGRIVPEYGREEIRETFLRSYRIVYEITPDAVMVLTVFEGHRRLRP